MPAYMIFVREDEVFDVDAMQRYQQANRRNIGEYNLKPLVVYGSLETAEGKPADGIVLLEFPSMEEAKAWYYSAAYQQAAEFRKQAANYRVFFVEGV